MPFLTERERHTLALVCDTLVPALQADAGEDERLFGAGASAFDLAVQVEAAFERVTDKSQQQQLRLFFQVIENGLFNRVSAGQRDAFSRLTLDERTQVLASWAESRLPLARRTFQALKRLTMFLFYSAMPDGQPNPTWPVFAYAGPSGAPEDAPRPIRPLTIDAPTTLHTDALVIGSGAGGGVVAGELTAAGYDVIVVEKGGYHAESDFHGQEQASTERLFEKYGALTTDDVSMIVLAGSTLGGGTTINWSASLLTPETVLNEWATDYGFTGATSAEFQQSLDAVLKRMNVNTDECVVNPQNAALERGCRELGYDVTPIPRNVKGCEECGFCNYGCAFGAKQGTLKTYLQDAHERGARIVVHAQVERVLHRYGVATGALVTVEDEHGARHEVTIHAKAAVVAAGTIHTPVLLMRSGLSNANIGANLHLHPVTVAYGIYDEPVRGWTGHPMTRYTRQFANLDGRGYGVRLETAPVHPGIAALTLPWVSGRGHKRLMQKLHHMANIIVLTRDYYGGRVSLGKDGSPVLHYNLHPHDGRHLMRGLLEALRVHRAAGAVEVSAPHNAHLAFRFGPDKEFEGFLAQVEARGFKPNAYALFSAHQMSSCRIGGNTALGAVDPTGETYEIRNLFVADGSVLPTASGVNPMVTIMGTAHYLAQQMKSKL
jgi:choline dehydrogenase-like flavoprotein